MFTSCLYTSAVIQKPQRSKYLAKLNFKVSDFLQVLMLYIYVARIDV